MVIWARVSKVRRMVNEAPHSAQVRSVVSFGGCTAQNDACGRWTKKWDMSCEVNASLKVYELPGKYTQTKSARE